MSKESFESKLLRALQVAKEDLQFAIENMIPEIPSLFERRAPDPYAQRLGHTINWIERLQKEASDKCNPVKLEAPPKHYECIDCDAYMQMHTEGYSHCGCGFDWINNRCETQAEKSVQMYLDGYIQSVGSKKLEPEIIKARKPFQSYKCAHCGSTIEYSADGLTDYEHVCKRRG